MADLAAQLAAQLAAGMAQLTAARAETFVDSCTAVRPDTANQTPVLDADGNVTPAAGPTVYQGPCVISQPTTTLVGGPTPTDEAGAPEQRELRGPHDMDLATGDLVTMTACAFSPGLVGDVFVVVGEHEKTYATKREYIVWGSSWQPPE